MNQTAQGMLFLLALKVYIQVASLKLCPSESGSKPSTFLPHFLDHLQYFPCFVGLGANSDNEFVLLGQLLPNKQIFILKDVLKFLHVTCIIRHLNISTRQVWASCKGPVELLHLTPHIDVQYPTLPHYSHNFSLPRQYSTTM